MTILLVRHAESAANVDHLVYGHTADHIIKLTEKGRQQAKDAGIFINDWFKNNPPKAPVRLWASPYIRTTQTALLLRAAAPDVRWDNCSRGNDIHFDDRLREREWGAHQYADYALEEEGFGSGFMLQNDPQYHAHYHRVRGSEQGRYFARPKGGESAADIALRLRSFFHDLYFDIGRGVTEHVIVLHGMSMLAFVYAFTKVHPMFFDAEPMGNNTAVRLLDKDPKTGRYADYGFVYEPAHNVYLLNRPDTPIVRDVNARLAAFLE